MTEGGSAAQRLAQWRSTVAMGIARTTALLSAPAIVWLLWDAVRHEQPRVLVALSLFELSSIGAAIASVRWQVRARWMVCNQLVLLWLVAPETGTAAGFGALVLLLCVECALLLGLREAIGAFALSAIALNVWPVQVLLADADRPIRVLADGTEPLTALRMNFVILTLAGVALAAVAYILSKLTNTMFEAESLVTGLRSEMRAREEEAQRRRNAEADLIQAQRLETLGSLAGGVAHDVNNNLTVTLTCVELIERAAQQEPRIVKWCGAIRHAVENASALTRQLLTLGRRDLARPSVVTLDTVFERIQRILPAALGKHVHLELRLSERLPPLFVDPAQLEQVLLNLAINARDAMPSGGDLTISAECGAAARPHALTTRVDPPARAVRIQVADTGTGIPADALPKIMEPFFTTKGPVHGTGLGLAVARAFVDASGGRLCVDSREGEGSTFTLELPTAADLPARLGRADAAVREDLRPDPETVVLVVDDDARIRKAIASELRHAGYQVIEACDGIEALEHAKAAPRIDLLCTDVAMPRLGGQELLSRFQKLHADARILVCSAYVHEQRLRELLAAGHHPVLPKPFSPVELRGAVARALAVSSTASCSLEDLGGAH